MNPVYTFLNELRWDHIPEDVRQRTRLLLLDLLGTGLSATATPLHRIVTGYVDKHHGGGQSRVLFTGQIASPEGAALAGGMTIDAVDAHDGHRFCKGHVGCSVLPALLAEIDHLGLSMTGERFLTLLAASYEIGTRAGSALHATAPDYHTSGAWGAVNCAALAAHLLALDAERFDHALGIAEYHGPRSQMMRGIDHPTMLKDGSGWGALTGISSAHMAEAGFTGAPAITVLAEEVKDYWSDLGENWEVMNQYIKGIPVCRWAQPAAQAALELAVAHELDPDAVETVEIHSFHQAVRLYAGVPQNTEQAQYAISFPVAAALVRQKIGVPEISEAAFGDADLLRLLAKIKLVEDGGYSDSFPAARWAHVKIVLKDGTELISDPTRAKGDPDIQFSDEEIVQKFRDLAGAVVSAEWVAAVEAAVIGLDATEASFERLGAAVFRA